MGTRNRALNSRLWIVALAVGLLASACAHLGTSGELKDSDLRAIAKLVRSETGQGSFRIQANEPCPETCLARRRRPPKRGEPLWNPLGHCGLLAVTRQGDTRTILRIEEISRRWETCGSIIWVASIEMKAKSGDFRPSQTRA